MSTESTSADHATPAPLRNKVELRLGASRGFPRGLHIELTARDNLFVAMHSKSHVHLGGASARFADCYLDTSSPRYPFLCVGAATFLLSANEVVQIRATFAPLGLRVRETDT